MTLHQRAVQQRCEMGSATGVGEHATATIRRFAEVDARAFVAVKYRQLVHAWETGTVPERSASEPRLVRRREQQRRPLGPNASEHFRRKPLARRSRHPPQP